MPVNLTGARVAPLAGALASASARQAARRAAVQRRAVLGDNAGAPGRRCAAGAPAGYRRRWTGVCGHVDGYLQGHTGSHRETAILGRVGPQRSLA